VIDLAEDEATSDLAQSASFTGYACDGDWNGEGNDDLAVVAPRSEWPGG
jgi:hypothetical protein